MVPQINYELSCHKKKRGRHRLLPARPVIISYETDRNKENLTTLPPPHTHTHKHTHTHTHTHVEPYTCWKPQILQVFCILISFHALVIVFHLSTVVMCKNLDQLKILTLRPPPKSHLNRSY